ncbi:GtrA family protein [Xanthobacter tagetidis]|uniref:GtrA family protein n=2 Tax=Xanthobacter tagetidis TaxID=60216 RepID=A0A3L7A6C7_9HYPH|nr:GtrA family protein [Xanthobacter tagetidis]
MVHDVIRRYQPLIRQVISFAGAGGAAAVGHFSTLAALVELDLAGPVRASACGFLVGGVISYVLNRRFTFNATRSHVGAVPRFIAVAGVAFVLNAFLMDLLVHRLGLFYLLAQVITTGLVLIWTFSAYRIWAFRHAPEG